MKAFASTAGLLVCSAGLVFVAAPASADTVTLNNGREIHGRLIEEGPKEIQIRTGQGVITIPKFKVATFSENENWGNYDKPRSVKELKAIEEANRAGDGPKEGGKPAKGTGDKKPAAGAGAAGPDAKGGEWAWAEGVSPEKIEELTPIRDELQKQLEALGPTKEERLKGLTLSREEAPDLKDKIRLLGWKRGRGGRGGIAGSQVYREKAKNEILSAYGVRAIEGLVKALGSENLYQARWAAQTLEAIHKAAPNKRDSLWLMNHFEAPAALVALLDNEGDTTSQFVRGEANQALEVITGEPQGWPRDVQSQVRTPVETAALKKWRRWAARNKLAFVKGEEDKEATRKALQEKLALVRDGKNPEEEKKPE